MKEEMGVLRGVETRVMYNVLNIHRIFHLLMQVYVTSASVERANSAIELVKTVMRSTMGQDRMNALVLLFVHKDIIVDYADVIDKYSRKHPIRMLFMNAMSVDDRHRDRFKIFIMDIDPKHR